MSEYTLHLGDCLDVMRGMDAGSVDAVITDPPYGINYKSGKAGRLPRSILGDSDTTLRDIVIEQFSGCVPMAVFATWHCTPPIEPRGCLIWEKNTAGMGDLSFPWQSNFEMIWIYGEGWAGHRSNSILRSTTIVTWNSGLIHRLHPHEKPVGLMKQLINKLPQGITILDPFMGSGTTGVACIKTGRRFVGIEIDPTYFAIAQKRIDDAAAQPSLFEMGQLA